MKALNKIALIFVMIPFWTMAQDHAYTITKVMPEFPGGTMQLAEYLKSNVNYPSEARENNYSGKSYVNFIVDTTGQVISAKIVKSSGYKCLDEEALRVVTAMPKWNPGSDSITKVKVSMNLPIGFKNLGTVQAQSNLTPEEQAIHEKAMKYYYEGHKYEQQEYYEKALAKFDLSLTIEPKNKFALFDKAKMHQKLGNKVKACEIWKDMSASNLRKNEADEFLTKYCN